MTCQFVYSGPCTAAELRHGCGYNSTFQSQCQDSQNQEQGYRNRLWLHQRWNFQEKQTKERFLCESKRRGKFLPKLALANLASTDTLGVKVCTISVKLFFLLHYKSSGSIWKSYSRTDNTWCECNVLNEVFARCSQLASQPSTVCTSIAHRSHSCCRFLFRHQCKLQFRSFSFSLHLWHIICYYVVYKPGI